MASSGGKEPWRKERDAGHTVDIPTLLLLFSNLSHGREWDSGPLPPSACIMSYSNKKLQNHFACLGTMVPREPSGEQVPREHSGHVLEKEQFSG